MRNSLEVLSKFEVRLLKRLNVFRIQAVPAQKTVEQTTNLCFFFCLTKLSFHFIVLLFLWSQNNYRASSRSRLLVLVSHREGVIEGYFTED